MANVRADISASMAAASKAIAAIMAIAKMARSAAIASAKIVKPIKSVLPVRSAIKAIVAAVAAPIAIAKVNAVCPIPNDVAASITPIVPTANSVNKANAAIVSKTASVQAGNSASINAAKKPIADHLKNVLRARSVSRTIAAIVCKMPIAPLVRSATPPHPYVSMAAAKIAIAKVNTAITRTISAKIV